MYIYTKLKKTTMCFVVMVRSCPDAMIKPEALPGTSPPSKVELLAAVADPPAGSSLGTTPD